MSYYRSVDGKMEQIKFSIDDELRAILTARAADHGHSIGAEIRDLLWVGLATMTLKPITKEWSREAALTHSAWESQ